MNHPSEIQLALFAGSDLGFWDRWRIQRHVSACSSCEESVQALRAASGQVRELATELPKDLNWNRLSEEMTGNIRVGLAAGEAIARFDKPSSSSGPAGLRWNAAMVLAGASVVFAAAFWMSLPQPQADHLRQVLMNRGGSPTGDHLAQVQENGVIEISRSSIEVKENGRSMSLLHPSGAVTVSVSMRGSAGVRYVDADSGQVTTNKVYYADE